nr:hypothetical protein [Tanacetum cinerariifolium]
MKLNSKDTPFFIRQNGEKSGNEEGYVKVVSEQDVLPSSVELDFRARLDGGRIYSRHLEAMARSSNIAQDSSGLRSRSLPPVVWSMDIIAGFCGPSRWKELSKESGSKILPCGDGSCWKAFKPIAILIASPWNEHPFCTNQMVSDRIASCMACDAVSRLCEHKSSRALVLARNLIRSSPNEPKSRVIHPDVFQMRNT